MHLPLEGLVDATRSAGGWAHTFGVNFQSGYKDAETTVEVLDANGLSPAPRTSGLDVKPYFTFDWQSMWNINKYVQLRWAR